MNMLKKQTKIFKALSDSNRIRILKMLQIKPLCVCEITSILGLATSTVSQHLSILKSAKLITDEKDKKWINYKINPETSDAEITDALFYVRLILKDDSTVINDRKKLKNTDRRKICGI